MEKCSQISTTAISPERCTVCRHPDRARVELAVARGIGARTLAKQFGLRKDGILRHRRNHMPAALVAQLKARGLKSQIDLDKLRHEESQGTLEHLIAQRGRLNGMIADAIDLKDIRVAILCERQLLQNLETCARLLGDIGAGVTHVQNNLVLSPDYLNLRRVILQTLQPYPEAKRALARALVAIDSAEQIKRLPPPFEDTANMDDSLGSATPDTTTAPCLASAVEGCPMESEGKPLTPESGTAKPPSPMGPINPPMRIIRLQTNSTGATREHIIAVPLEAEEQESPEVIHLVRR